MSEIRTEKEFQCKRSKISSKRSDPKLMQSRGSFEYLCTVLKIHVNAQDWNSIKFFK